MLKRKVLPVVLVVLFSGVFWAFQSHGGNGGSITTQQKILTTLGTIIEQNHYNPKAINDNFSQQIFKKFLESIDPDKNIFLQADVNSLKKYETSIDDEIHGATMQFVPAVDALYSKRMQEVMSFYKELLARPFDFNANEEIVIDGKKLNFAANESQRKEVWKKKIKFLTLERYTDLLDQREKNKDKKDFVVKTNAELEKEAREKVGKIMDKNFERIRLKFNADDRFNIFINTITSYMDPHSDYFPPVEKRMFDEQMSGKFYGIGASLKEEEGNIKVASLLTGSPAWKSGEIQVGDIVMKVGQGKDEPAELTGLAVEDAVKIIRGNKGTEVRLTLKKPDGSLKLVPIIRDEIVQDEVYVRSAIVNGKQKIGYIFLPDFYADYEKPDGHRCSSDVAKEIQKLKAEGVDGIVMDLRNNGGGYLPEVVEMVGLFIQDGPIVQVKDREGKATVLRDNDKSVAYTGPLTVLINEFSASASEIFAAAIQDYGRGVIIGSTSSYGKGTVQRNIPFGRPLDLFTGRTEFGAIKLTLQKFYRINGGSTQLRGVTPDIVLPDEYEYLKFREKDNENALPWDEIEKTTFNKWQGDWNVNEVKAKSAERIKNNVNFNLINSNALWLSKQNDKIYSLNLDKYKTEQKALRATVKQNDSLAKLTVELPFEGLKADEAKYNNVDKDKGERYKNWLKNLKTDIYINEAANVIKDMTTTKSSGLVKSS
ncbi:carboxy terminal-processing peptidase [Segetibacter sp.]|uniref:carboxy terminal-processing peptidase n=1 Tax=Segetibacter sp. TaxID=2231182 RepID=UPI002602BD69|nr:carboxy terminal-processing peptidase [Segetibacter sp.]MCW3078782.1 tail-specific protease [Segetibacter sp.]